MSSLSVFFLTKMGYHLRYSAYQNHTFTIREKKYTFIQLFFLVVQKLQNAKILKINFSQNIYDLFPLVFTLVIPVHTTTYAYKFPVIFYTLLWTSGWQKNLKFSTCLILKLGGIKQRPIFSIVCIVPWLPHAQMPHSH